MVGPSLVARVSSFAHPNSRHDEYVSSHPFNSSVELFLPLPDHRRVDEGEILHDVCQLDLSCISFHSHAGNRVYPPAGAHCLASSTLASSGPGEASGESLAGMVTGADADARVMEDGNPLMASPRCYRYRGLLQDLVASDVVECLFRRRGALFCAIQHPGTLDRGDVVCISEAGKLHMALCRDTYETLGITGHSSRCAPKERYNVTVDLLAPSYRPGKPLYDRLQSRLRDVFSSPVELLCVASLPEHLPTCPSATWAPCPLRGETRQLCDLRLPPIGALHARDPGGAAVPMDGVQGGSEGAVNGVKCDEDDARGGNEARMANGESDGWRRVTDSAGASQAMSTGRNTGRLPLGGVASDVRQYPLSLDGDSLTDLLEWVGAVASGAHGKCRVVESAQDPALPIMASSPWAGGPVGAGADVRIIKNENVGREGKGVGTAQASSLPWPMVAAATVDDCYPLPLRWSTIGIPGGGVARRWTGMLACAQILACLDFAR
eukprot:jgi/Mesvir1/6898/Mv09059-RA.1